MKNIYLTSDSLTNGNQLAPYGVARVLKKILFLMDLEM